MPAKLERCVRKVKKKNKWKKKVNPYAVCVKSTWLKFKKWDNKKSKK